MKEKTQEKDNKKMPHRLALVARVGAAARKSFPQFIPPFASSVVPCGWPRHVLCFLFASSLCYSLSSLRCHPRLSFVIPARSFGVPALSFVVSSALCVVAPRFRRRSLTPPCHSFPSPCRPISPPCHSSAPPCVHC